MINHKSLFIHQSYLDSYDTYEKSLKGGALTWDYIVLTASNDSQAMAYNAEIEDRLKDGALPSATKYAVIPDPDGKRCGSGGATLAVLKYIAEREGNADFNKLRILCIHSGGDSKRVPQYSACGKIFSPVPRMLKNGRRSTLFDELIIATSGVPCRFASGMLVCSGDVLVLFNPLQLDFYGEGAAALSVKEHVSTGKNHGVFLGDSDGNVKRCLQKQSEKVLSSFGAVDKKGNVDIDTGAVIFSGALVNSLYSLIEKEGDFAALVNERTRLSFYADFLYPLAKDSTLEDFYKEAPEGELSNELLIARKKVWDALNKYSMKLIRFSPASFLHFGTTRELLKLMTEDMPGYKFLGWSSCVNTNCPNATFSVYNSYISKRAEIEKGCYIENSDVMRGVKIGKGSIVSSVTLKNVTVPENTVLHGLKLGEDRYVCRVYGVNDNPKENIWRGQALDTPLWTTPLFKVCDTMEKAVRASLDGESDGELLSLMQSFNLADVTAIIPWQDKLNDKIIAETVWEAAESLTPVSELVKMFPDGVSERVERYLLNKAQKLELSNLSDFSQKIRVYYYASKLVNGDKLSEMCFDTLRQAILSFGMQGVKYDPENRIKKDEVICRLPVRINFGGGWSDTPPHCLEKGGAVLNAAISLDGNLPIEVTLKRIDEDKIILASTDIGSYREFTDIQELQYCENPNDAFSLHKSALMACSVIPRNEQVDVKAICERLGGGIYMNTRVINIPKGSGLGTSSILAAACAKGIFEFLGKSYTDEDVYNSVLAIEQLMSTGGGWQDQIGGFVPGIKLITSDIGIKQQLKIEKLEIPKNTLSELGERLALVYTGQRRLARNLLREVVGKYIGSDPVALEVLSDIQALARDMRDALVNSDIDKFCELLNLHWEKSKRLDMGCTNTCIDQILYSIEDLTDARMICGAGGGGFLQVVMKKGVSVEMLSDRLDEIFGGAGVQAVKCDFYL